ncbi:MAG: RNA 2',3'-cyclic phosphodiesterase [Propionicimonas sp.]|uniref:RNA 2',3'-cyclic phosphodiesterase n=1 Tax=Propionicimonas sp. TaxID=1955623 RepID=UPI002B1F2CAB|nr:RNA 2',3'-cyclic phosphodiesterase [Propionicimonas sp.]MEA4945638.1 RNA 2',3'-cyclic phosphodiesterase [Propionicimonas sp.]MEA5051978.1 RNA 2',3'-cyclic phosphodiesterase [Propionicimonas sp.]MEA5118433.1 RNA 2',3'-cyclic phosphodiesterase [Propionicimonas sp.]
MGKRLFLAVRPPASVTDDLEARIGPRRDTEPALRWAQPEHWHVTLAFLGDVAADHEDRLVENLGPVAESTTAFDLTLGGAGCFPQPGAAKVLWLGARDGAAELEALARRCRTAASRAGIHVDGGRFQPHLTLARSNRGIVARRWLALLDTFGTFGWQVADFLLIDSELTRGGPRHRVIERFGLAGSEKMPR